jgi:aminopeptidase N
VLKQLVAYVRRDNFLAGVRRYFAAHSWGNATLADLLSALEAVSGRDLTAWSREWLETAGVNTLRPSYTVDAAGRFTSFSVLQEAAETHPVLRSHRIGIGLYSRTDGALRRTAYFETDISGPSTPVPELVGQDRPDLVLVNDDDLTYAKIRLDDHSLKTLVSSIGEFDSSLPAALCWAAAWDMTRDGEMATRDYVRLVLGGAGSVQDISVVQTLLRQAALAVRRYADQAWRPDGIALMASSLRSLLLSAAPGSDHQLAYARSFAGVATSAADLELLSGLLSGAVALDGLAVDTDLRWTLLRRLVSRGVLGEAEIDAELSADATDAGERHAATCRAAVPTAEAKRETWETLTGGKLTIAMFRATLVGFVEPDQEALVGRYRRRTSPPSATCGGSGARRWRRTSSSPATTCAPWTPRRSRPPTRTWPTARRPRRCAGCSARAATTCSGRSATRPATAPEALSLFSVVRTTENRDKSRLA